MELLALKIGEYEITGPAGIPTGGSGTLSQALQVGINLLYLVAILLSLVFLFYGGIDWIRSEGDKTKVQSARRKIIYAIIGLVIVLLSFVIMNLVGGLLGVNKLV